MPSVNISDNESHTFAAGDSSIYQDYFDRVCALGRAINDQPNTRTMTFRCKNLCGGLGDRMRGVITTFYVAILLGYRFRAMLDWPSPISDYFEPTCSAFPIAFGGVDARVVRFVDDFHVLREPDFDLEHFFFGDSSSGDVMVETNSYLWQNVIMNKRINETDLVRSLRSLNFLETGHIALNLLFGTPLVHAYHQPIRPVLGIHFRSGDNYQGRQPIALENLPRVQKLIDAANDWIKQNSPHRFSLFVSADNEEVVRHIHVSINASVHIDAFDGDILHIDHDVSRSAKEFNRTFQDWIALGQCDVLFMGRSGFPFLAAIWKLRPHEGYFTERAHPHVFYRRANVSSRAEALIERFEDIWAE
eukprot:CAMPEP_0113665746 /NCGR_PEP_ID=MMETSP0038_2-20120614/2474_1 /TAXON_ID=2898 /ORGANISM="Cryptomonas paramecium" /LENGTH=359 /DNA_ID=CAMNT_0000581129 /DNA_START=237 /DNA_END=1316 /DNA_ORIENTATION=- /assembly_acc=CAM_ASM_000170